MEDFQINIFNKHWHQIREYISYDKWSDFSGNNDNQGGFIMAHWDGTSEPRRKIKEETKATIRCIPFKP